MIGLCPCVLKQRSARKICKTSKPPLAGLLNNLCRPDIQLELKVYALEYRKSTTAQQDILPDSQTEAFAILGKKASGKIIRNPPK